MMHWFVSQTHVRCIVLVPMPSTFPFACCDIAVSLEPRIVVPLDQDHVHNSAQLIRARNEHEVVCRVVYKRGRAPRRVRR